MKKYLLTGLLATCFGFAHAADANHTIIKEGVEHTSSTQGLESFVAKIESVGINIIPEQEKMFAGQPEQDQTHHFQLTSVQWGVDQYQNGDQIIPVGKDLSVTCYYQSNLAQIINSAFLQQSSDWYPFSCDGLTKDQIAALDFNKIEFPKNYLVDLKDRLNSVGFQKYMSDRQEAMDYAHVYAITRTKNLD